MLTYEVYMNFRALDLLPKQNPQRREVMNFMRSLGERPFTLGDYVEEDASSRVCQVKIVSGYAVTYWADHAVKGIVIVAVQKADRGYSP